MRGLSCSPLSEIFRGLMGMHFAASLTSTLSASPFQTSGLEWKYESVIRSVCPTLCDPMGYSPPRSSVLGILQARTLQWAAISFSRGSSWPREQTRVSCTTGQLFTFWTTGNTRSRELSLIPLGLGQVPALTPSGPDHDCQRSCYVPFSQQDRARSGVSQTPSSHLVHWTSRNLYLYIDI